MTTQRPNARSKKPTAKLGLEPKPATQPVDHYKDVVVESLKLLPPQQCTMRICDRADLFPQARYAIDVPIAHVESNLSALAADGPEFAPDLDPEYQRAHVWTRDQQVKFVEYMLLGGEVARNIIFAVNGEVSLSRWRLIDGKQRLTALRKFIALEFGVFADEAHPNGHFANAIADMRRFTHSVRFVVVCLQSKLDELNLYLSINTAGTPHTQEELDKVRAMRDEEIAKRLHAQKT